MQKVRTTFKESRASKFLLNEKGKDQRDQDFSVKVQTDNKWKNSGTEEDKAKVAERKENIDRATKQEIKYPWATSGRLGLHEIYTVATNLDTLKQLKKDSKLAPMIELFFPDFRYAFALNEPEYERWIVNGILLIAGKAKDDGEFSKYMTVILYQILAKGFSNEKISSTKTILDVPVGELLALLKESGYKEDPKKLTPSRFGRAWMYFNGDPTFAEGESCAVFGQKVLRGFPDVLQKLKDETGLCRDAYIGMKGFDLFVAFTDQTDSRTKAMVTKGFALLAIALSSTLKSFLLKKNEDFFESTRNRMLAAGYEVDPEKLKDLNTMKLVFTESGGAKFNKWYLKYLELVE